MNENEVINAVLPAIIERGTVFGAIKRDIYLFLEKSQADKWLSPSQVSTIHEIFLLENQDELKERLDKYIGRQLKRESEHDKWQRNVDINGKKAMVIDHFSEMVEGLLEKHYPAIEKEIEDKFRIPINKNSHSPIMQQTLIKIFDHIFVTTMRILNIKGEGKECLKN